MIIIPEKNKSTCLRDKRAQRSIFSIYLFTNTLYISIHLIQYYRMISVGKLFGYDIYRCKIETKIFIK